MSENAVTKVQHQCPYISNDNSKRPITKEECTQKHNSTKYIFTIILALIVVFLGLLIFVASAATMANDNSDKAIKDVGKVRTDLRVYIATKTEYDKAIVVRLEQIKEEIKKLREEQNILFEKVLTKDSF